MASHSSRLGDNLRAEDGDDGGELSNFRTAQSNLATPLSAAATPAHLRADPFDTSFERAQTSHSHLQQPRTPRRVRSSSVRIQRLPSNSRGAQRQSAGTPDIQIHAPQPPAGTIVRDHAQDEETQGRRRSFSAPERREDVLAALEAGADLGSRPASRFMPMIEEGQATAPGRPMTPASGHGGATAERAPTPQSMQSSPNRPSSRQSRPSMFGRIRSGYRGTNDAASGHGRDSRASSNAAQEEEEDYEDEVANILDVVDPEVSTLATLTNVQNSLFVPDLGRLINRRPTYKLSAIPTAAGPPTKSGEMTDATELATAQHIARSEEQARNVDTTKIDDHTTSGLNRSNTITSRISESRYAVLPHGTSLQGWSQEDKDALNDYVRHMLHSRRNKFKRSMRGFWKYIQRPLGFFVTLYAFLITVFGLIWVLFLIGWISGGSDSRHKYLINVIDNVLVALFAVVGDGLAPFRAVDTYHMIFIAHYARLTWKLRKKERLPKLENRNDLPTVVPADVERASTLSEEQELSVLSPLQQRRLAHHQKKFARSHTFYKPHETTTHYAFSIRLLMTVVVLLDLHSLLQISLGSVTWGWDWHHRPAIVTTVILICSITCNITAGIVISIGDKRSRKVEVVEQMFRQTLTQEAIKRIERQKQEQAEKQREGDSDKLMYPGT